LIPQGGASLGSSDLVQLPLNEIRPNRFQPRKQFDEESLIALVDSIKAVGVLQPVLVRELGPDQYEIIAGERRYRAARRAGLATIPAVVREADDASSLEQALVENLQREDLNPLDEAAAYQQLIEDFELTHDEVGHRIGKSRTAITNSLRLFQLPPSVQRHVRDGLLSAGHARALLGSPDRALQERLALEAVRQGLSVRAVEEMVRSAIRGDAAPAGESDAGAGEAPGAPDAAGGMPLELAGGRGSGRPGTRTTGTTAPQGSRLRPPGMLDLEELLGDYLNTRVSVDMGSKHGRVLIEFANLDDLERIYRVIIGGSTQPA
jgi:ParB family chromosome partitioning protein